jgi:hypothetical protein
VKSPRGCVRAVWPSEQCTACVGAGHAHAANGQHSQYHDVFIKLHQPRSLVSLSSASSEVMSPSLSKRRWGAMQSLYWCTHERTVPRSIRAVAPLSLVLRWRTIALWRVRLLRIALLCWVALLRIAWLRRRVKSRRRRCVVGGLHIIASPALAVSPSVFQMVEDLFVDASRKHRQPPLVVYTRAAAVVLRTNDRRCSAALRNPPLQQRTVAGQQSALDTVWTTREPKQLDGVYVEREWSRQYMKACPLCEQLCALHRPGAELHAVTRPPSEPRSSLLSRTPAWACEGPLTSARAPLRHTHTHTRMTPEGDPGGREGGEGGERGDRHLHVHVLHGRRRHRHGAHPGARAALGRRGEPVAHVQLALVLSLEPPHPPAGNHVISSLASPGLCRRLPPLHIQITHLVNHGMRR